MIAAKGRSRYFITRHRRDDGSQYFLVNERIGGAGAKLRYRPRWPGDPPVYDPPRIQIRSDHGGSAWVTIAEEDIIARCKTAAEAYGLLERLKSDAP